MSKIRLGVFLLVAGMSLQNVSADEATNPALEKTQTCLRSQNCDSAKTDAGKEVDQKALDAVGGSSGSKQELYNISSDIMPILVQQADGDPMKLQAIVMKAQTDPEGFLNSLPPAVQAKIKGTASTVENNQAAGKRP